VTRNRVLKTALFAAKVVMSWTVMSGATSLLANEPLKVSEPVELGALEVPLAAIQPLVEQGIARGEFAGCVIALGRSSGLFYLQAYGDRQIEPKRNAMTTETLFDLASLTKPVATATSVMRLVEQGKVRLSDPVAMYLPEFAANGKEAITIDQLLVHAGGLIPDNSLDDYFGTREEMLTRTLAEKPTVPPGTQFQYTDVGFMALGALVEKVSGQSLKGFAAEQIFKPLEMEETGFLPPPELAARAAATEQCDGRWLVGEVHDPRAAKLGGIAGHAGLFSTAEDLARYAMALLKRDEFPLGPATLREMTRPREISGVQRCLGWDSRSRYSINRPDLMTPAAFGHSGFTGTSMWIDPELDLFVIFLSTRLHPDGVGNVNDLAGRIGNIAAGAIRSLP